MNTFTSFCIAGCIFFIFFGISLGLISQSGFFPTNINYGNIPSGSTSSDIQNMSSNITGISGGLSWSNIWVIATGSLTAGAVILSILTKTTNMIAVWLFGSIFWSAWLSVAGLMTIIDLGSMAGYLLAMVNIGMVFMFIAAINGMLSGSIWMR